MEQILKLGLILEQYGLSGSDFKILEFGSGLINHTWKICGTKNYILQHINQYVFKKPEDIAFNLELIGDYFQINTPKYLFVRPLPTLSGDSLVRGNDGEYYRLLPFVENSVTINEIDNPLFAYEAARQFGQFTFLLNNFDSTKLHYTLPQFHDLSLRFNQFQEARKTAEKDRMDEAEKEIKYISDNVDILDTYQKIITQHELPLRVIHHDTKISNVLFNQSMKGLCVIDLDTVMPGYFISDIGDMMRTYLSSANEEEKDFSKIQINEDCFYAIYEGYLSAMSSVMTPKEKQYFTYSGKYMIYMQALRFLTDFLNGDSYYHTTYPKQNLIRAQNQIVLLQQYINAEQRFCEFIQKSDINSSIYHN